MIFKTFNSDIDKISAKWGMFGRSFNDVGTAIVGRINDINRGFQATDDLIGSIKNSNSIWRRLYPSKEDIKEQIIDVDTLYPDKTDNQFSSLLTTLIGIDEQVKSGTGSWQKYFKNLSDGEKWQIEFVQNTDLQKASLIDVKKAYNSARETAIAQNAALKQQTLSAKAATVAAKALAVAGNMLLMFGISEAVSLIYSCATASDRLKESAESLGNQFSYTKSEISDYKTKIEELNKIINDDTSSYEETYEARKNLLSIQDEMIEKFGSEAESVSLVTDAINGQTDALDTLTEKKWLETVNRFNNDPDRKWYEKAADTFMNMWSDNANNFDRMKSEMENTEVSFHLIPLYGNENYKKFTEKLQKIFDVSIMRGDRDDTFTLSGDLDDIYKRLLNIQQLARDLGMSDSFLTDLSNTAASTKNSLEQYDEIYGQHVLYDKILNHEAYEKSFNQINEAYKGYQESYTTGDENAIEHATQNFAEIVQTATEGVDDQSIINYFNSMYPDLKEAVSKWEFEVAFKAAMENDQDDFEQIVKNALGAFQSNVPILVKHIKKSFYVTTKALQYYQLGGIALWKRPQH